MKTINLTRRDQLRQKWLKDIPDDEYEALWELEIAQEGRAQYEMAVHLAVEFLKKIATESFLMGEDNFAARMRGNSVALKLALMKDAPTYQTYTEEA